MLIRKKKTKKKQPEKTPKPKPTYDPNIGSGYVPGISDGSWLLPDSARSPIERTEDADSRVLWRPRRGPLS